MHFLVLDLTQPSPMRLALLAQDDSDLTMGELGLESIFLILQRTQTISKYKSRSRFDSSLFG